MSKIALRLWERGSSQHELRLVEGLLAIVSFSTCGRVVKSQSRGGHREVPRVRQRGRTSNSSGPWHGLHLREVLLAADRDPSPDAARDWRGSGRPCRRRHHLRLHPQPGRADRPSPPELRNHTAGCLPGHVHGWLHLHGPGLPGGHGRGPVCVRLRLRAAPPLSPALLAPRGLGLWQGRCRERQPRCPTGHAMAHGLCLQTRPGLPYRQLPVHLCVRVLLHDLPAARQPGVAGRANDHLLLRPEGVGHPSGHADRGASSPPHATGLYGPLWPRRAHV